MESFTLISILIRYLDIIMCDQRIDRSGFCDSGWFMVLRWEPIKLNAVISLVYAWPLSCNFLHIKACVMFVTHSPKKNQCFSPVICNQISSYRSIEYAVQNEWNEDEKKNNTYTHSHTHIYILRYVIFYVWATRYPFKSMCGTPMQLQRA